MLPQVSTPGPSQCFQPSPRRRSILGCPQNGGKTGALLGLGVLVVLSVSMQRSDVFLHLGEMLEPAGDTYVSSGTE